MEIDRVKKIRYRVPKKLFFPLGKMSTNSKIKKLEADMKAATLNFLKIKGLVSQCSTVINELTLDNFSRRVDLAIIEKGRTYAIEVKSASDSLYRLDGQVEEYLQYFDKVIVVAASRHIVSVLKIVPSNVAVWELKEKGIVVKQKGRLTPIKSVSKFIDLMKANELYKLSNRLKLKVGSRSRRSIEGALATISMNSKAVRDFCLQCIHERYRVTSQLFWERVGQQEVLPCDIPFLSRTRIQRERESLWKKNQVSFWNEVDGLEDTNLMLADISFGATPDSVKQLIVA